MKSFNRIKITAYLGKACLTAMLAVLLFFTGCAAERYVLIPSQEGGPAVLEYRGDGCVQSDIYGTAAQDSKRPDMQPEGFAGEGELKCRDKATTDTLRRLSGGLLMALTECDYIYPEQTLSNAMSIIHALSRRKREQLTKLRVLENYTAERMEYGVFMRLTDRKLQVGFAGNEQFVLCFGDGRYALPFCIGCDIDDSKTGWAKARGMQSRNDWVFDGFIFFVKENGLYYIDDWYGLPAGGMDDTVWTVLPKEGIV